MTFMFPSDNCYMHSQGKSNFRVKRASAAEQPDGQMWPPVFWVNRGQRVKQQRGSAA